MMKHRMMTSLAIAAIAAATPWDSCICRGNETGGLYRHGKGCRWQRDRQDLAGLKNSDGGVQYYDTEDGVTISVVQADGNTAQEDLPPQKTDENGNRYFEMADGSRIYVTPSRSASVN